MYGSITGGIGDYWVGVGIASSLGVLVMLRKEILRMLKKGAWNTTFFGLLIAAYLMGSIYTHDWWGVALFSVCIVVSVYDAIAIWKLHDTIEATRDTSPLS